MGILKWSPGRDFLEIQEELNQRFEEYFNRGVDRRGGTNRTCWTPRVDIAETQDSLIVSAEIPGSSQEEIKVSISEDILTIEGEKKQEKDVNELSYHCTERSYGNYKRIFRLPVPVQTEKIKASYKEGVLRIELPREGKAMPKEIQIEVK
jgi:HSP20 family protein